MTVSPLVVRWARIPDWGKALLIYGAARVVTTIMMLWFAAQQAPNPWTGAAPGYAAFASIWDGRWYQIIAFSGYPSELPVTEDGHVGENAWAFMPIYPGIVRIVMGLTQLPWEIAALVVSVPCGFAAAVVFLRLMREVLDRRTALFAVVLFSVAPVSPILQVAYAESLYLLLLGIALLLVMRHRYLTAIPIIVVMALTRPSGLAFALFLLLHLVHRLVIRARQRFSVSAFIRLCITGLVSAVMGCAWLLIAWAVTGSPTAYTDTELAWRSSYVGYGPLVPFAPWVQGANWWVQRWLGIDGGWLLLLAILALAVFGLFFTRGGHRLGITLRLWTMSYAVYLLAVFFPQSSTFRLLAPLFPIAGALAVPRSRAYRVVAVVVSLALQWIWIWACWAVSDYDWTPP